MPLRPMQKRFFLAMGLSFGFSVSLGLLHAATATGQFSLFTLQLPGVVPVALLGSALAAIVVTPLAVWSVRTGTENLYMYGPVLWVVLALYILLVLPRTGRYWLEGTLLLAIIGLIVLGLIPPRRPS